MGWKGERGRHSMASRGINTKQNLKANGQQLYRDSKMNWIKTEVEFNRIKSVRFGNGINNTNGPYINYMILEFHNGRKEQVNLYKVKTKEESEKLLRYVQTNIRVWSKQ